MNFLTTLKSIFDTFSVCGQEIHREIQIETEQKHNRCKTCNWTSTRNFYTDVNVYKINVFRDIITQENEF